MSNIFYRFCAVREAAEKKDGHINVLASTADACDMGGWREVLMHGTDCIDTEAARSLLINHDANQLAGKINSISSDEREMSLDADIDQDARMQSGIPVRRAVDSGALKGFSIGYTYSQKDTQWDDQTRTLKVNRWRLLEGSLTPIPADKRAHVRSLPFGLDDKKVAETTTETAAPAAPHERISPMTDPIKPQEPTVPAAPNAVEITKAAQTRAADICNHAEALGLRASDYVGMEIEAAREKMLADVGAQRKAVQKTVVAQPATIQVDEKDKIRDQAVDALIARRSGLDVARRFASRMGSKDVAEWSRGDLADYILGGFENLGKRVVNISSGFSEVTQLATKKVVQNGYDSYTPHAPLISQEIWNEDFKTVRIGDVQLADFAAAPGEGNSFADLTIADGGGSGTNEYRGGMLALSKEAIYNDEMGRFFDKLYKVGRNGLRSIDKSVDAGLEGASFTGGAAGTGLLSVATLTAAWAAHAQLVGPAGERLTVPARRLIVPLPLYITGEVITRHASGEQTNNAIASQGIEPVSAQYLTDANDWYLACDPADACAIWVIRHPDYKAPMVIEVDSGDIAQRRFRVEFPFKTVMSTNAAGKPVGIYKVVNA